MTHLMYINSKKIKFKNIALAGLASALIFSSAPSYANKYIASAEEYLNKNEISAAIIELKNAIKNSPKDAQPRLMLGEIYLTRGNFLSAEKELSRALKLDADKETVLPLLVRAIAGQGRNEDVINLIDDSNISDPYARTELLSLKAFAELNLGKTEEAEFTLQQASSSSIDTLYTQLGQARINAIKKNTDAALASVNQLIEKYNDNSDIWLLKGHLESAKLSFEEAEKSYKRAYELSPDAFQYTVFIARALVFSKRYEEAEKYIDDILDRSPSHILSNELKATILFIREDFAKAKEHANRAINNGSNQTSTLLISGVSSFKLELYEQAHDRFVQLEPRLPKNHYAKRMHIATQLHLGYVNEAIETMNQLNIESDEDSLFISQASMQLSKLGRDEEALKLAQKASNSGNDANELMLGLVKIAGNDKSGFANLRAALANQPNLRLAEIGLGQYYLKQGEYDEAEITADKWLALDENDIEANVLKGLVYQAKSKYSEAEAQFKKALTSDSNHMQARVSLAQVKANQQDWQGAYDEAYKAKVVIPDNKEANKVLLFASKKLNNLPDVIALMNEQIQAEPTNVVLKHYKAYALALNTQVSAAINELEVISDADKTPETWALLGDIYYSQQNWYDTERAYAKWLKLDPTNVTAHIRNIHIRELTEKMRTGIKLANKASEIFPNDVRFPLMKAGLLLRIGDLESSQKVLDSLDKNVKKSAYVLKLQGLIHLTEKDFSSAVAIYETKYQRRPGLVSASELATVYVLNRQEEKAIEFLSEVIKEHPTKARALEIKLADILIKVRPDEAIEQYKAILTREPNNILALNNLAWIHLTRNQNDLALEYAEKAYKNANQSIAILDTYGYTLLKSGDIKKAVELTAKAYSKLQDHPEVALHHAESLLANKQTKQAKVVLAKVVTEDPDLIVLKGKLEEQLGDK